MCPVPSAIDAIAAEGRLYRSGLIVVETGRWRRSAQCGLTQSSAATHMATFPCDLNVLTHLDVFGTRRSRVPSVL